MGEGEFGLSGVVPKCRSVTTAQSERLPQVAFFGSFLGEARKERPTQWSKVASLYRNIDEWYCLKAVPRAIDNRPYEVYRGATNSSINIYLNTHRRSRYLSYTFLAISH